jgi:hypothetical protein
VFGNIPFAENTGTGNCNNRYETKVGYFISGILITLQLNNNTASFVLIGHHQNAVRIIIRPAIYANVNKLLSEMTIFLDEQKLYSITNMIL